MPGGRELTSGLAEFSLVLIKGASGQPYSVGLVQAAAIKIGGGGPLTEEERIMAHFFSRARPQIVSNQAASGAGTSRELLEHLSKDPECQEIVRAILALGADLSAICSFIREATDGDRASQEIERLMRILTSVGRYWELIGESEFAKNRKAARARSGNAERVHGRRRKLQKFVLDAREKNPDWSAQRIAGHLLDTLGENIESGAATLRKDVRSIIQAAEEGAFSRLSTQKSNNPN